MLKLDVGNVLLKPSHRRQLMSWLKRAMRFGDRMGNLVISITMHRVGRAVEMRAGISDQKGTVVFRDRQTHWHDAARNLVRTLTAYLHDRMVHQLPA